MNPEALTIYQLRKVIDSAQADANDLTVKRFALPVIARRERNKLEAKIINRLSIIAKAEALIVSKTAAAQLEKLNSYPQTISQTENL